MKLLDGDLLARLKVWLERAPPLVEGAELTADSAQRLAKLLSLLARLPLEVEHLQVCSRAVHVSKRFSLLTAERPPCKPHRVCNPIVQSVRFLVKRGASDQTC